MALHDQPIVDESSERSEESVLKTKSFFKRKNNFLSREEFPDYGVDLDIELLENGKVNGFKFAIQIKSVIKANFIKDNQFFSLAFLTSRLGYLMRRLPGYGIVVIYDDSSEILYFDYVEEIIFRIRSQRKSNEWESQGTVKINIPVSNVITLDSVKGIYNRMYNRHISSRDILYLNAHTYNIPQPLHNDNESGPITDLTVNNLKLDGERLFNEQKFLELDLLLEKISYSELNSNHDLQLIAAMTFSEIGKIIDADYFIRKCENSISKFSKHNVDNIQLLRLRIDYILGRLSIEQYYEEIEKLIKSLTNEKYIVNLEINQLYIDSIVIIGNRGFSKKYEDRLLEVHNKILKIDIDDSKRYQLLLLHLDTIFNYTLSKSSTKFNSYRIGRSLEGDNRKMKLIEFPNKGLPKLINTIPQKALQVANQNNYKLLEAKSKMRIAKYFCFKEFRFFIINNKINLAKKESFFQNFLFLEECITIFRDLTQLQDLHSALSQQFEFAEIFTIIFQENLPGINLEVILEEIKQLESDLGVKQFQPSSKEHYENVTKVISFEDRFLQASDEALRGMAEIRLKSQSLPKERLQNIIDHYQKLKIIYSQRSSEQIEPKFTVSFEIGNPDDYAEPVEFILVNSKTGYTTESSVDVKKLLNDMNENGM